mmetsp:Transcript_8254/g.12606  ORF Transcript_8254/g.12606 Transcript_8254/m.12606 type:complete len:204 (-) Transcript_8254:1130-1741(-)
MTRALDTEARAMSPWLISPGVADSTFTVTSPKSSAFFRALRAVARASADPCTSALITTFTVFLSIPSKPAPNSKMLATLESKSVLNFEALRSREILPRASAIFLASCSLSTPMKVSPARGRESNPIILTGAEGPASVILLSESSLRARTRPHEVPARKMSPTRTVPLWIRVVATGPRPFSTSASTITPDTRRLGFALSSITSA